MRRQPGAVPPRVSVRPVEQPVAPVVELALPAAGEHTRAATYRPPSGRGGDDLDARRARAVADAQRARARASSGA